MFEKYSQTWKKLTEYARFSEKWSQAFINEIMLSVQNVYLKCFNLSTDTMDHIYVFNCYWNEGKLLESRILQSYYIMHIMSMCTTWIGQLYVLGK